MPLILGIDAAWTEKGSSGVALLDSAKGGRLIACAPSYSSFIARANGEPIFWHRPQSSPLDVAALLSAAERLGNADVDIVAIDMPIASIPFSTRRVADQKISREFGAAWASTHSPNADRPGEYGRRVSEAFIEAGYPLATSQQGAPALIEVSPLAALVRLLNVAKRPLYKVSKRKAEWRDLNREQRIAKLLEAWSNILDCLNQKIASLAFQMPKTGEIETLSMLKPYEDGLDAIISAYVGALYNLDCAEPFGDEDAAIWVPAAKSPDNYDDSYLVGVSALMEDEWHSDSDNEAFEELAAMSRVK